GTPGSALAGAVIGVLAATTATTTSATLRSTRSERTPPGAWQPGNDWKGRSKHVRAHVSPGQSRGSRSARRQAKRGADAAGPRDDRPNPIGARSALVQVESRSAVPACARGSSLQPAV